MTTMTETAVYPSVDQIRAEASEIASANPPSRVLLTCVLGILVGLGWLVGRAWFAVAHLVAFCGLGIKYGYRLGAKVQTQPPTTRPTSA